MARAPFSIEWLSQSSRCPPSTTDLPVHRANPYDQTQGLSALYGHLRLAPQQHQQAQMTPKSSTSGGVDSGYESEAGRSDCVSPQDKESRRCPSVSPAPDSRLLPSEWLRDQELHCQSALNCASQEDSRLCPADCAPQPEEEDRSLYPEDSDSQEEDSGVCHEEEGSPLRSRDCATTKEEDSRLARRIRTAFSSEQINSLEKTFKRQKYLSAQERRRLAAKLQLSEVQLKTWFQNRRMKLKRQLQDMQPDPYATAPFYNAVPYGQPAYAPFFQYASAGQLPLAHAAAGMAYTSMVPSSLYPMDPYKTYAQPQPMLQAPAGYSEPPAFAYY
ncbi:homeobox protein vent1-like [Pleurodeles waltl]